MKKILVPTLAARMSLPLAACGGNNGTNSNASGGNHSGSTGRLCSK